MKRYVTIITIIGMISAGLVFGTGALAVEEIQKQAPLVFEYNLTGPKVFESQVVEASGLISEIRASWDFEGEARLEVSANAGSSYTPIVCGEVLTEGFIPGNQLRFRVHIADDGRLKKLVLGYKDSSGVNRLFYNQELPGFKYHKILRVEGVDKELFNYPLKIELGPLEGVKADYSDIRFTAADGQIPLNYYLERFFLPLAGEVKTSSPLLKGEVTLHNSPPLVGGVASQSSPPLVGGVRGGGFFWVKVPQIPKEGVDIHLYYGNSEAKDASNSQGVFLFFDDFNSPVLDEQKWQARLDLESKYSLKAGYLELKNCSIFSRAFKMKSGILEFKAKAGDNSAVQAIVKKSSPYQGEAGGGKRVLESRPEYATEHLVYSSGYPGAEHTIAVNDMVKVNSGIPIKPWEDYIYKVSALEATDEIIFERYDSDYQKQAEIRFLGADNSREGSIGLKSSGGLSGEPGAYFDWARARPYAKVEPKVKVLDEKDNF